MKTVKVGQLQAAYYAAAPIIDAESGEELVKAGAQIGEAINKIQASDLKSVERRDQGRRSADPQHAGG